MLELNNIYNMDCMEGMKQFPDNYFELAIVDPPYGIDINNNIGRRKGDKHSGHKIVKWDSKPPNDEYFEELYRVSKNQIIWGGNYYNQIWKNGCKGFVIWDKLFSSELSFSMYEFAWTSFDVSAKGFRYSPQMVKNKIHPTQKPIKLYRWLLQNYAKKGDKILDTHLGSGSSVIACLEEGFDYMAFELDKDYFEATTKRIENYKSQLKMF